MEVCPAPEWTFLRKETRFRSEGVCVCVSVRLMTLPFNVMTVTITRGWRSTECSREDKTMKADDVLITQDYHSGQRRRGQFTLQPKADLIQIH